MSKVWSKRHLSRPCAAAAVRQKPRANSQRRLYLHWSHLQPNKRLCCHDSRQCCSPASYFCWRSLLYIQNSVWVMLRYAGSVMPHWIKHEEDAVGGIQPLLAHLYFMHGIVFGCSAAIKCISCICGKKSRTFLGQKTGLKCQTCQIHFS